MQRWRRGERAGGGSSAFFLLNSAEWGRLVIVFDLNGVLVKKNQVIEPGIQADSTYGLATNVLTGQDELTIKFAQGTSAFQAALTALDDNLPKLGAKGTIGFGGGPSSPPFDPLPRNAALKLTFNNNLSAATLNANTVQTFQGFPAITPFPARLLLDVGNPKVLVIDPTISQYEADTEGGKANSTGFPQGITNLVYNMKLSIPGGSTTGQFGVLLDEFNNPLTASSSDPVEAGAIVRVFRSALPADSVGEFLPDSQLPRLVGFQKVSITPASGAPAGKRRLTYTFNLGAAANTLDGGACFLIPGVGDVFVQGSAFGVIKAAGDDNPTGGNPQSPTNTSSFTVDVTVLQGAFGTGVGTTQHLYVDGNDKDRKACFVDYSIDPTAVVLTPGGQQISVNPATDFTVHFSKPMNPATVLANDTLLLGNNALNPLTPPNTASGYYGLNTSPDYDPTAAGTLFLSSLVPVQIVPSFDQRSFTVHPVNPLRNSDWAAADAPAGCDPPPVTTPASSNVCHFLHLLLGTAGPKDLGNNPLPLAPGSAGTGGSADFEVLRIFPTTSATANKSNGISLRFNTTNLVEDGTVSAAGNALFGGNLSTAIPGQLSGRPVVRFSRVADQGVQPNPNAVLDIMAPTVNAAQGVSPVWPVKAPLLPFGCRMQTVYRYFDVGFTTGDTNFDQTVDDFSQYNLDVEGLNWSPDNGIVLPDKLSQIQINLSHSQFQPDEYVNNATNPILLLCYPFSGLGGSASSPDFASNSIEVAKGLDPSTFGPKNVYIGIYQIDPLKSFQTPPQPASGTILQPWPTFQQTFLWRDTRLVDSATGSIIPNLLGGGQANGIDPDVFCQVGGLTNAAGTGLNGNCHTFPPPAGPGQCQQGQGGGGASWKGAGPAAKIKDLGYPPSGLPSAPTVPSIGLPLLVEFLVNPDLLAKATNRFRTLEANPTVVNASAGNPFPLYPKMRLISGGGVWADGSTLVINPQTELLPQGEVVPGSLGLKTFPGDDVVYVGQLDFVTKTSLLFSRWFDTGTTNPTFTGIVLEPTAEQLGPLGLTVEVSFRGGTTTPVGDAFNATKLDPYGNIPPNSSPVGNSGWSSSVTSLNGKRYFQVRLLFRGNSSAMLPAWLTGLQVAWKDP